MMRLIRCSLSRRLTVSAKRTPVVGPGELRKVVRQPHARQSASAANAMHLQHRPAGGRHVRQHGPREEGRLAPPHELLAIPLPAEARPLEQPAKDLARLRRVALREPTERERRDAVVLQISDDCASVLPTGAAIAYEKRLDAPALREDAG